MKFNEERIARLRAVAEACAAALTFGGGTAQPATCFVSSIAYPTIQSAVNDTAGTGSTRLAVRRAFVRRAGRVFAAAFLGLLAIGGQAAMAADRYVATTGSDFMNNCTNSLMPCMTIQHAINVALPNDTVHVAMGAYPENVTINKSLTLNGAQAGNPIAGRTFAFGESTVTGMITIQAANVTIDGFSLTNPGQDTGILVKTAGDDALITNNIIQYIGGVSFSGNTQAIYLERGPDDVKVVGNRISNVASLPSSNGGIFIGDSTSPDPSLNILIQGNSISNIQSVNRGAYGIHVNNGNGNTFNKGLQILDNTIDSLAGGGWVHAIGLEAKTPGVVVNGNSISKLVPAPLGTIAVWFESEEGTSFATGQVHENNLDVTMANYGIAVDPALSRAYPSVSVSGTCNWWGDSNGPGPVGPGMGARVTPNVAYTPWLIAPAPGGVCLGGLPSTPGKVTGGGEIESDPIFSPLGDLLSLPALIPSLDPSAQATFGFVAKCCAPTGNLEYNDHAMDVRIKVQSIDVLNISMPGTFCSSGGKHATFGGMADVIRPTGTTTEPFRVDVDDCGEPGTMDTFGIKTMSYTNGPSPLIGGNIQIH